jgi:Rieske Fe-S protein
MNSLGFIGHNPNDADNIYIVTGDSGNGITHGTIAGILIPDLINGVDNPWKEIYDPARTHILKSGKTFIKEFLGGWLQYMKNSPKHADKIMLSDIKPGQAKIIEMEKEKFGAYRDADNALHIVSATCTHLGCVIRWNNDEKSWDCPCHGSRFTPEGKVLNGPAIKDLIYYKEEYEKK